MSDHDLAGISQLVEDALGEFGLTEVPPEASERLSKLASLLAQWNQRMNLTGHRQPREIAERLIVDALGLAALLPAGFHSIADLGSGAGFPGLPLAIVFPHATITLVEARERRVHFQRAAIRALSLGNALPLMGRAETLDPHPSHIVTAQAMAAPETVLRLASRWALPGGVLVIPSSERVADEAMIADPKLWERRRYRVPLRSETRALLLHRFPDTPGSPVLSGT